MTEEEFQEVDELINEIYTNHKLHSKTSHYFK